jgi:hypothetical protein
MPRINLNKFNGLKLSRKDYSSSFKKREQYLDNILLSNEKEQYIAEYLRIEKEGFHIKYSWSEVIKIASFIILIFIPFFGIPAKFIIFGTSIFLFLISKGLKTYINSQIFKLDFSYDFLFNHDTLDELKEFIINKRK